MRELSAEILLRPTRIGYLTSPTDLTAVRAIMRSCMCIWGGAFNPIIPVFKRAPKEWRPEIYQRFKGAEVAKGYAQFFEPDVYIETKKGLLEEAGLGKIRGEHILYPQVITMKEFLEPKHGHNWAEPAFGLNICEAFSHIYRTEQQFVQREPQQALYVLPESGSCAAEAMFGVYPAIKAAKYIEQAYQDVYRPKRVKLSPDVWRQVYLKGAVTPLRATRHGLDVERYWYHDRLIFVFDATRPTDLIDLWNLRLEPYPVLPIPIQWFQELSDDIHRILKNEYRPVVGNPNGVMHNATIEFGRSIPKAKAENAINSLKQGLPKGALAVKFWRNAIWAEQRNAHMPRNTRLKVMAKEHRVELVLKEGRQHTTTFEPLVPEFTERYGRGDHRWANVLKVSDYSNREIATVLPFNTFDRKWPRLGFGGEPVAIGSEGWVFTQRFTNLGQYVSLLSSKDAIIGSFEQLGIEAKLSEPGHIALQMLEQLGGLWGTHLLADIETLNLLNKMAGGLRRRSNASDMIEENHALRTATLQDWNDLVSARKQRRPHTSHEINSFTERNVIRLGLETDCPHCKAKNWNTLTSVDYIVTCERCLKPYDFPQATLRDKNKNFTYRVIGPFATPDYGRGAYSALLTLRTLQHFNGSSSRVSFSTAMDLSFDNERCEVDFVAWRGEELIISDKRPPQLIIGESKSIGRGDLIKSKDIAKLKLAASKLPGSVVVISLLRDHFTSDEKRLLQKFVNWGRRVNIHGEPTNPVVLFTAHELTMEYLLSATWKNLGGKHEKFANQTGSLLELADATQQIYLGLPSFHEARHAYWEKRLARRKATQVN